MTLAPWPEHHLGAIRSAIRAGALRESCLRDLAAILRRPLRDVEAKVAELGGVAKPAKKPPRWKAPISWRRLSLTDDEPLMVELSIVTLSEANQQRGRAAEWDKRARAAWQVEGVTRELAAAKLPRPAPPLTIRLTRIARRELDSDNAVGALKHVRDSIAAHLGIDDGPTSKTGVRWEYGDQERGEPGVRIEIER